MKSDGKGKMEVESTLMAGGQETDMRNHHSHYFN